MSPEAIKPGVRVVTRSGLLYQAVTGCVGQYKRGKRVFVFDARRVVGGKAGGVAYYLDASRVEPAPEGRDLP